MCNTHLDHQSAEARARGSEAIGELLAGLRAASSRLTELSGKKSQSMRLMSKGDLGTSISRRNGSVPRSCFGR